jgi:phosphoribosylformylglycinamidine (FGAM) synthase-like enzyme
MDLKTINDLIYIVGATHNELGGSEYLHAHGLIGNSVPRVDPVEAKKTMEALSSAIDRGLIESCHDCSEGGMGVAIAEMAFAGGMGASIYLKSVPKKGRLYRNDFVLFSESNSRFIVEVDPRNEAKFKEIMRGVTAAHIGHVNPDDVLEVYGLDNKKLMRVPIKDLKEAWQKPLRW